MTALLFRPTQIQKETQGPGRRSKGFTEGALRAVREVRRAFDKSRWRVCENIMYMMVGYEDDAQYGTRNPLTLKSLKSEYPLTALIWVLKGRLMHMSLKGQWRGTSACHCRSYPIQHLLQHLQLDLNPNSHGISFCLNTTGGPPRPPPIVFTIAHHKTI